MNLTECTAKVYQLFVLKSLAVIIDQSAPNFDSFGENQSRERTNLFNYFGLTGAVTSAWNLKTIKHFIYILVSKVSQKLCYYLNVI